MKMNEKEKKRLIKISLELKENSKSIKNAVDKMIDIKRNNKKYNGLSFIEWQSGRTYKTLLQLETLAGIHKLGDDE
tara:strand:- start:238 stop:465 length:228 start_codon:yes stop_codon:yes gene_type:complete